MAPKVVAKPAAAAAKAPVKAAPAKAAAAPAKAVAAPAKAANIAPRVKAEYKVPAGTVIRRQPALSHAAHRQVVAVRAFDKENSICGQSVLPSVFVAPIRPDIVHFVHTSMAKNRRQAYAVSDAAGHQHSAESWGTGRAVSRIPRVSGGGTSRAGQAAFGNMVRKGRMFAPTKTWRKWHRKINTNQKRFAVASALAASALPSLVLARGHRIGRTPEIPLVLDAAVESVQKTKAAILALKAVGAYEDVIKAKESRKLRRGKGKLRNRRHVARRGPLIVFNEDHGIVQAFRNLPGVELAQVDALNLLQLAPGGHLGRFIIWTKGAFDKLNANWGSTTRESTQKKGYRLPRPVMINSDLTRLINSDEIQSKVRAAIKSHHKRVQHKNPLTNLGVRVRLNPYASTARRTEIMASERQRKARAAQVEAKRSGKKVEKSIGAKQHLAAQAKHEKQSAKNYEAIVTDNVYRKQEKAVVVEHVLSLAKPMTRHKDRVIKEEVVEEEVVVEPVKKAAGKKEEKKDDKKVAEKKDDKKAAPAAAKKK